MCTLQNQCMESWPTSAPTEAPQLEKEEGYLHHLQLQATVGNRDPLYAPPHTSLSRPNSSSKKMQIMHKILYSVFSNWPAVGTNTGGYKPEDTLKIQAVTIFRLYCFTEASQSLLPEPSYQCQPNPFAHIFWKTFFWSPKAWGFARLLAEQLPQGAPSTTLLGTYSAARHTSCNLCTKQSPTHSAHSI